MKDYIILIVIMLSFSSGCMQNNDSKEVNTVTESYMVTEHPLVKEPQSNFSKGLPHKATSEYNRFFTVASKTNGTCTLSIDEAVFDEEQAVRLWETVDSDLQVICSSVSTEQRAFTVYVVDDLRSGHVEYINGIVRHADGRFYCKAEDIESGQYRESLIRAVFELDESWHQWKLTGLLSYVFDSKTADEAVLHDYYEQEKDIDVLSLFPAYFIDSFADEKTVYIANETAISLTAYIINRYGSEAFLRGDWDNYKQEWLNGIGVEREYYDHYMETLAGYVYTSSESYPLIITTDRKDVMYVKPFPDNLETAGQLRLFLYEAKEGMKTILDGMQRDAPEYMHTILDNYSQPIYYYFIPNRSYSNANADNRSIYLAQFNSFYHETMHIVVQSPTLSWYIENSWRYEGIVNYLWYTYYQPSSIRETAYMRLNGTLERDFDNEQMMELFSQVRGIYQKYADIPANADELVYSLYCKSVTEAIMRYPEIGIELTKIVYGDLTYDEAHAFADYLINKYSLSIYLRFCLEPISFEEAFDTGYDEALEEWLDSFLG